MGATVGDAREPEHSNHHRAAFSAPTPGIGPVTQVVVHRLGPFEFRQLIPQRRHAGQAGDAFRSDFADDVPRQQVVHQDDAGACAEGGRELAESVVETQWQYGQQAILLVIFQVFGDA